MYCMSASMRLLISKTLHCAIMKYKAMPCITFTLTELKGIYATNFDECLECSDFSKGLATKYVQAYLSNQLKYI